MRVYFYLLAGLNSALVGWNLGQVLLTDLHLLRSMPEVILFPCIAISLAVGLVANEIFISNPTRPKLNLRIIKAPLLIAGALGLVFGLVAGGIVQVAEFLSSDRILRVAAWLVIGFSVGLAEGVTWRWRSVEAGDLRRYRQHVITSVFASIGASLAAALLFEWLRSSLSESIIASSRRFEDPIGFSILGLLLGLALSITSSPSYMVALRAGAGFEHMGTSSGDNETARIQNVKNAPVLKFISEDTSVSEIEEGLSIRLPNTGSLKIGSSDLSSIYLPGLPLHIADLELKPREAILDPNPKFYSLVAVNGIFLKKREKIHLKHNFVLTFNTTNGTSSNVQTTGKKFYRFIYYNRFLDPQS